VLHGSGDERIAFRYPGERGRSALKEHAFEGVIPNFERRHRETESQVVRDELAKYRNTRPARIAAARACARKRATCASPGGRFPKSRTCR
jgi:excinuclease UvrABC ATPase subunit